MGSTWKLKFSLCLLTAWVFIITATRASDDQCAAIGRQSPINLIDHPDSFECMHLGQDEREVVFKHDLSSQNMYHECSNVTFRNEGGHTARLELENCGLYVEGGGLVDSYHVLQVHFHWGSNSQGGSEHTIDGKKFPIEMHIVTKMAGSSTCAQLGVFAVMLALSPFENHENEDWADIIRGLGKIKHADEETVITRVQLQYLTFGSTSDYFRYFGSLTTYPYTENVIWTVFSDPVYLSAFQLAQFETLLEKDGKTTIVNNFREVQPLNGRTVQRAGLTCEILQRIEDENEDEDEN